MHAHPAFAALFAVAAAREAPAQSIDGNWVNPSGSVTVTIAPCGSAMCGTVIKASEKAKADAKKGGTNELIGTILLSGLTPDKKGHWKGKIFVPDMNLRSKAKLVLAGADTLKVSGCGPTGFVCKAQKWKRVPN
jgi:uncharacterized protein (DUF2147 family)